MDQAELDILAARDAALAATQVHIERHRDEKYVGLVDATLTETHVYELIGYRMRLRDLEKDAAFPNVSLPIAPSFIG